jgi:hypothetical protein
LIIFLKILFLVHSRNLLDFCYEACDGLGFEQVPASLSPMLKYSFLFISDYPSLSSVSERIFQIFEKSPAFILALYTIITYSIIALVVLTVYILLNRRRMEDIARRKNQLNEEYQGLLIDYFFTSDKENEVKLKLSRIANSDFNRRILINQIIDLGVNMQGNEKMRLRDLYLELGLKKDSLKKVYSRKWHKNIKGFRELSFMNIREANDRIIHFLNSSNRILRMEAQIVLVRLSDKNPYEFLDFLEQPLSVWEQINIHELLMQHNLTVPDFKQWFTSENLTIVHFSLQMVAKFKQVDALPGVIYLLQHEDDEIRKESIRTCGELGQVKALEPLKAMYPNESYENKTEILVAFGKIPDEKYLEFLNEVLDMEEDVQLQILATKAMENLDEPGIARLIKLMKSKSEYKNYKIIIRHVLDGRIY